MCYCNFLFICFYLHSFFLHKTLTGQIRQNTTTVNKLYGHSEMTINYILTFYLHFDRAFNKNKTLHVLEIQKYPVNTIHFCTAIAFGMYFNIQWFFPYLYRTHKNRFICKIPTLLQIACRLLLGFTQYFHPFGLSVPESSVWRILVITVLSKFHIQVH